MHYKLSKNYNGDVVSVSKILEDTTVIVIPFDHANTDYQEYLKWLEEGNTPLTAEEN